MSDLDIVCVIPARGGSKGIYKKNERLVGGKPLVAWSIIHALNSGLDGEQIIVSSDSESILQIAADYRVSTHVRPDEISNDDSPTEEAIIDALQDIPDAKHVITLQPTSPFRFKHTLTNCIYAFLKGDFDSLLTTTKFYNFCWQELYSVEGWHWKPTYDPNNRPMRQDLSKQDYLYFDNGNIYITNVSTLKSSKCRIGDKVCVFPISFLEGFQIDTLEDIQIAQYIFEGRIHGL